jgi:hypothetical protein
MANNGIAPLQKSVLGGILGAFTFIIACHLVTWFFSMWSTFGLLRFVLAQSIGVLSVGAFVAVLCHQYRIKRSFWVAFTVLLLTYVMMFASSDFLNVPLGSSIASFYAHRIFSIPTNSDDLILEIIFWNLTLIAIGFVVSLLFLGFIAAARWFGGKRQ